MIWKHSNTKQFLLTGISCLEHNYFHCSTCSVLIVLINFARLEEHLPNDGDHCDVSKKFLQSIVLVSVYGLIWPLFLGTCGISKIYFMTRLSHMHGDWSNSPVRLGLFRFNVCAPSAGCPPNDRVCCLGIWLKGVLVFPTNSVTFPNWGMQGSKIEFHWQILRFSSSIQVQKKS